MCGGVAVRGHVHHQWGSSASIEEVDSDGLTLVCVVGGAHEPTVKVWQQVDSDAIVRAGGEDARNLDADIGLSVVTGRVYSLVIAQFTQGNGAHAPNDSGVHHKCE